MFLSCDECLRAGQTKHFQHFVYTSRVKSQFYLQYIELNKNGPRLTANWNSGDRCTTYGHAEGCESQVTPVLR
jgi:hypothetical protein